MLNWLAALLLACLTALLHCRGGLGAAAEHTEAMLAKDTRPRLGFLPPLRTAVQLIAFDRDPIHFPLDDPSAQMKSVGHVGIRFACEPHTIYGFTPWPLLTNQTELVSVLLYGSAIVGRVADDTHYFVDASQSPYGMTFGIEDVRLSHDAASAAYAHVLLDMQRSPLTDKVYAFPPEAPRTLRNIDFSSCDGTWGKSCFNCATYPASLGIPIPERTGIVEDYMRALALSPDASCYCYRGGSLVSPAGCAHEAVAHCKYVVNDEDFMDKTKTEL